MEWADFLAGLSKVSPELALAAFCCLMLGVISLRLIGVVDRLARKLGDLGFLAENKKKDLISISSEELKK